MYVEAYVAADLILMHLSRLPFNLSATDFWDGSSLVALRAVNTALSYPAYLLYPFDHRYISKLPPIDLACYLSMTLDLTIPE